MWLRAFRRPHHILLSAMVTLSGLAVAHDLDEILVTGRRDLVGDAVTASEGVVGPAEINSPSRIARIRGWAIAFPAPWSRPASPHRIRPAYMVHFGCAISGRGR